MLRFCLSTACLFAMFVSASAAGPTYTDPAKTDADFALQGEYVGEVAGKEGPKKLGVQLIALGKGKFRAVGYSGGLPGDGAKKEPTEKVEGEAKDGKLELKGKHHTGVLENGKIKVTTLDGKEIGLLEKVERKSPTLGQAAPSGAVVLFDGSSAEAFSNGKISDDKLLQAGCTSKQKFGSFQLHIEFRIPYQPEDGSQGRGNSGVYMQGKYEVQMLDSFGLEGKMNECGGIYSVKDCDVNAALPPLSWQTFDIDYTAAKYEGDKLTASPRIAVKHNGILIHDNVELPGDHGTTAAPVKAGPEPGPIYLQDHGNPVRYRNIWLVEKP